MKKSIYIKTEPGGKICLGRMLDQDVALFEKSKATQVLSIDLMYKLKRGLNPFVAFEGVFNAGSTGDRGNEGIISLAQNKIELSRDKSGKYIDGFYAVYSSLSKVSIEFNIITAKEDEYNPMLLLEESVCIDLPACIKHSLYEDLQFNIVTNYYYSGKLIKNANKSMIDRGYEGCCYILHVENGIVDILYSNVCSKEIFH